MKLLFITAVDEIIFRSAGIQHCRKNITSRKAMPLGDMKSIEDLYAMAGSAPANTTDKETDAGK